jgi:hypothetical protein
LHQERADAAAAEILREAEAGAEAGRAIEIDERTEGSDEDQQDESDDEQQEGETEVEAEEASSMAEESGVSRERKRMRKITIGDEVRGLISSDSPY